ncbi:MAG TPA: phosphate-starvation-inducible PsiE family protein [Casimicrobiaceae bacterium]
MKITFARFVHVNLFERMIGIVFGVMLLFLVLAIAIGTVRLFVRLPALLTWEDVTSHHVRIVSDVLTLFIMVELSRSLADYFTTHRLRLTFIVDAGIVFILREVMIKLFEAKIEIAELYALSALLAVLGTLRTASVIVFQREKAMLEDLARAAAKRGG